MKLVVIESPFKAKTAPRRAMLVRYAKVAMKHALALGEAPFASHLLYTQVLDDDVAAERALGIGAGLAWARCGYKSAAYADHGLSSGMILGIENAYQEKSQRPVELRYLHGESLAICDRCDEEDAPRAVMVCEGMYLCGECLNEQGQDAPPGSVLGIREFHEYVLSRHKER